MKSIFIFFWTMWMVQVAGAQRMGIGTPVPDPSAILDITSTSQGLMLPSMTSAQRMAISNPAAGLIVFDETTASFWYYSGSAWINLSQTETAGGWKLNGNSGTNPMTDFLGTTDNKPLIFRVNNVPSGIIYPNGSLGLGQQAALNNGGYSNLAIGAQALYSNSGASNLVAIGDSALYANGIGVQNNLQGVANTAIGSKTLYANTIGSYNTAIGFNALKSTTSGQRNTATGNNALRDNTTGSYNTAFGYNALTINATGNDNTAFGNKSLTSNGSGKENTAVGSNALYQNSTGNGNTAFGQDASITPALSNNTTVAGYGADVVGSGIQNATAIGYGATVACSQCLVLGGTGANAVNTGISMNTPETRLHIGNGTDITASSGGFIQLGATNAIHLALDNNEIQARNNGVPTPLYLQYEGGLQIGSTEALVITPDAQVHRSASGSANADLLPRAYGRVDGWSGTFVSGTENMTIQKLGTGDFRITLQGEQNLYANRNTFTLITSCNDISPRYIKAEIMPDNRIAVVIQKPWIYFTNSECSPISSCDPAPSSSILSNEYFKKDDAIFSIMIFKAEN